jgi:hypothetical protein
LFGFIFKAHRLAPRGDPAEGQGKGGCSMFGKPEGSFKYPTCGVRRKRPAASPTSISGAATNKPKTRSPCKRDEAPVDL